MCLTVAGAVTGHRHRSSPQPTHRSAQLLVRGPEKRQRPGRCDAPTAPPNPPLRDQSPGESPHQSPRCFLPPSRDKQRFGSGWRGSRLWRSDTALRSPSRGARKPGVCVCVYVCMVGHLADCVSSRYQPCAAAGKAAALLRHCQLWGREGMERREHASVLWRGGGLAAAARRP